jgi:hypothetical protein
MSKILDRIHKHKAHDKRYSPFLYVTLNGWWLATELAGQPIGLNFNVQVFRHSQTKLRGTEWEQSSQIRCGGRLQTRPFV